MKKCTGCNVENDDDATYCKRCSKKFEHTVSPGIARSRVDYWNNKSVGQIDPIIRQQVVQQYRQYMSYNYTYAPTYKVKVQNKYYVVRSYGYEYRCPKCGHHWKPLVQRPIACPYCHVKYGVKVRLGINLVPWLIPLGVSVELST